MSFANYAEGVGEPWATPEPSAAPEPSVESALEKEKILKDILTLRDGLRGLMVRVSEVEGENDKLAQENETLGLYVENLTRNSVVAAGNQK
ncbi:hypothetical protein B9479_005759 [Cryptococcus floricola]|uniref:Short coiled-coil protein n=1 Tax=Cryptococcus floricola TaxID=2591691 RepID=A0A5D3ATS2_9TREE|nr:hypothetical protein B9479_005759 [Cryptococcus floricola]